MGLAQDTVVLLVEVGAILECLVLQLVVVLLEQADVLVDHLADVLPGDCPCG